MRFLFVFCALICTDLAAQKKIKTLEVSDTIVHAYIDRPGDLYLLTKEGQIQKFDLDGHLTILYKTHQMPTLFDPRDGARLFFYFRDTQHYEYRSPSFDVVKAYRIDSSFVIQPWMITSSGDHKLWVLDAADHSLKKINPLESEVEVEVTIDSTVIKDATIFDNMREYQGFVFLHDHAKGIHVFSGMGKHIKTIEVSGVESFNFLGEELYYLKNNKIIFFDLFSAETREVPLAGKARQVLMSDQRLFLIGFRSVEIFEAIP
jgi:hypothetical protein